MKKNNSKKLNEEIYLQLQIMFTHIQVLLL